MFRLMTRMCAVSVRMMSSFCVYERGRRLCVMASISIILLLIVLYSAGINKPIVEYDPGLIADRLDTRLTKHAHKLDSWLDVNSGTDDVPDTDIFYGVVIDAGSTGSRIHVFKFLHKATGQLTLLNETFNAIKPGLSSFSDNPHKAAKSLLPLMEIAVQIIPARFHRDTPIALYATAGLRLLPEDTADRILDEVTALFSTYNFHMSNDSVQILNGTDEGIFSWMTVNFLLGSLTGHENTVAALDLGGGSTQITFVPRHQETLNKAPKEYLTNISMFGKTYKVYTHSYLGLGLMSARLQIMGGKEDSRSRETNPTNNELESPCLPAGYEGSWSHQGTDYIIRGLSANQSGFQPCYKSIKSLLKAGDYRVQVLPELDSQRVFIFSYYYDLAADTGLIDSRSGGRMTVNDYKMKANQVCTNPDGAFPFHCIDLTYMYSLLSDGFGLQFDSSLELYKKISDVEISWALGAMFDIFSKNHQIR